MMKRRKVGVFFFAARRLSIVSYMSVRAGPTAMAAWGGNVGFGGEEAAAPNSGL